MFADFDYYKYEFCGSKITDEREYKYLGKRASKYISNYTNKVDTNTKDCECALAEYLQGSLKQGNLTSENIPNYYSASWGSTDNKSKLVEINSILELYLGDRYSAVGILKVIN